MDFTAGPLSHGLTLLQQSALRLAPGEPGVLEFEVIYVFAPFPQQFAHISFV